jgi:hypothetical protein
LRIPRIVAQNCPQLVYRSIDAVFRLDEYVPTPEPFNDGFPADELPPVLEKQHKQLHGNAFQSDALTGAQKFKAFRIELKLVKANT